MNVALVIIAGTFALTALLVWGPYYFFVLRPEDAARQTLQRRVRAINTPAISVRSAAGGILKEVERLSAIGPLNTLLQGGGAVMNHYRTLISQSGLKATPGQVLLGSACLALLGDVLVVAWIGRLWAGGMAALVLGLAPYVALRIMRSRRLDKFEELFPEAVDLIARTLRAGHAFTTGLKLAADEVPEPVAAEFRLLHDQQNYGLPLNDGLKNFAVRVPIIDARFFVTAVLTQREAGGNLAEVLDNLSGVIRERFRIKRQLRVLSARGRMTGAILAALPPALGVMMLIRVPDHFSILLEEPLGIRMIIVALALQALGAYMIHKITDVEY